MKKNNVLIELTPLLDVILIILFFILVQSEGRMGTFYEETREALAEEFALLEAQLEEYKAYFADEVNNLREIRAEHDALILGLEEDSGAILISIEADPILQGSRRIVVEADSVSTRIDLNWDAPVRDEASRMLNTTLTDKIRDMDRGIVLLLFRFSGADIYMADYRLVANAIHIQQQFHRLVVAELRI